MYGRANHRREASNEHITHGQFDLFNDTMLQRHNSETTSERIDEYTWSYDDAGNIDHLAVLEFIEMIFAIYFVETPIDKVPASSRLSVKPGAGHYVSFTTEGNHSRQNQCPIQLCPPACLIGHNLALPRSFLVLRSQDRVLTKSLALLTWLGNS